MSSGPIISWQIDGETTETVTDFFWAPKSPQMVTVAMKLKDTYSLTNLDSILKSRDITLSAKVRLVKASQGCFSSGYVWMLELAYKEDWASKNWCFWTVVLEKTLESPLDSKEIQLVYPKGNQSWTFTGKTDVEAEMPILWPPDVKNWLNWKEPDAGKDWGQEKGTSEDEMVWSYHQLNGHEFG